MFCPVCGRENPNGARFCGQCGRDLSAYKRGLASGTVAPPAVAIGYDHGKRSFLILVSTAVVILAVAVFGLTRCLGGRRSAQALADELTVPYQRLIDEGASDSSVDAYSETMLDAMPPEAIDALIEETGVDGREEAIEQMGSGAARTFSQLESIFDKVDFEVRITVGDELDDDYIDGVNEQFDDHDISLEVVEAYSLGIDMTMTAKEDVGLLEAGQTTTQEMSNSGMTAIRIGDQWYLWVNGFNW